MSSNFDFLRQYFPSLHPHATEAERLIFTAPRASCFYARFTLEQLVHWLYANDPYLQLPYDNNLGALIHEPTFKDNLKPGLFPKIRLIHKIGNTAVHDATRITESDSLRLVKHRLELVTRLSAAPTPTPQRGTTKVVESRGTYAEADVPHRSAAALRTQLLDALHQDVTTMPHDNFVVRRRLQQVETFSDRNRWNDLSEDDVVTIANSLASLPNGLPSEDPLAKEFDLLCLKLQLAILKTSTSYERLRDRVRDILSQLETKPDVPMIKDQLAFIQDAQEESWWSDVTPPMVEEIRVCIRELIKFIDRKKRDIVITDFADEMGEVQEVDVPTYQTGFSPYQYRKKVDAYIRANDDHITIAKLKRNLRLTETDLSALEEMLFSAEEVESRERFEAVYGKTKSLKRLIREIVGLDRNAAKQAFARYLEGTTMSANQIRFIENIIDFLTQNGIMDPGLLYEPPFTDLHQGGLDGVFNDEDADAIVSIVQSFNETVGVRYGT